MIVSITPFLDSMRFQTAPFGPQTRRLNSMDQYTKVDTSWRRAIERAGLKQKGYRLHDLRHSFCTRLIEEGKNPITIKQLSGHSTLRMLERYTHPGEDSRRDAINALDRRRQVRKQVDFKEGKG